MSVTIEFSKVTNATTVDDGTGYFDVLMNSVNIFIEDQYNKGRITGSDYATVYLGAMQSTLNEAVKFALDKQKLEAEIDLTEVQKSELEANGFKDREVKDKQIDKFTADISLLGTQKSELEANGIKDRVIKDKQAEQLDVKIASENRKLEEDRDKWALNKDMLTNQRDSSDIDLAVKPRIAEAGAQQKEKAVESAQADIDFNTSKRIVMEDTRKDNIRMKATEQYAEYLKYLGTAGLYPSEYHFANIVGLVNSINKGIENPSDEYTMIKRDDRRRDTNGNVLYWTKDPETTERSENFLTTDNSSGYEAYYRADSYKTDDSSTKGKY